ncbi:MAG: rRNA adenine N-6-methyltransferase family protein, partial [Bacillota bacterium]|nr:rRNA adenine N-6-methyltransferase family protein [Bacillota bacterium]
IMKVLEDAKRVKALVVMMQKEVAERILDEGDRGAITMTAGYYAESRQVASIRRNSFMPAPNVDSAVLSMTRIPPALEEAEENMYMRIVKAIYSSRRKTLSNSLNSLNICDKKKLRDVIIDIGYFPSVRGETLGKEDLLIFSKKFTALEER